MISQFLTIPKRDTIRSINAKKAKSKIINIENKWEQWYIKTDSKLLICWLSTLKSGESKKKVVDNTSQIPEIPYVQSGIFLATLNTDFRWSKRSVKKKHTVHLQGCYFWGDAQVLGCVILKKRVEVKDVLNEKQSLPCPCWCLGPLFYLRWFLRFVLLLMLHNSGKLVIPHDNLFLILHILHLVQFKFLQCQGELSISGRSDPKFVWNIFFVSYFLPSVSKSCPPRAEKLHIGLRPYQCQVKTLIW